ncbi:alpha/beta fold hydrolase [Arenimonas fontis]|uniref:Alpha/beta hydrolase n=1 Tax=Arenimonas fontis TaxID=2608255 RepID=A0A5B2Z7U8_9GAMM|nr:alpha/beta hydrolase [Arenimonas fontis]KAA2284266.1 alpha/beta hydrolase [Arenimonas fontis]
MIRELSLPAARGRLAALSGGREDGRPLLCLHGWLDNAASFLPLAPWLADFRWVALDLPGHGASEHRAPGYDYVFVDWIHDVLDALDALGWARADLLGHSMGGAIACLLAAAVPARVRRLALVEALGPVAGDPDGAGSRLREAVLARRAVRGRSSRLIPDLDAAVAARLAATEMAPAAARLIVERNLRPVEGGFAWRSDPRLTLPASSRLPEPAIRSMLRLIEAPTLVIAAEPSPPWFSWDVLRERAACMADVRLERVPGGHHLHMEQPGQVGPRLRDFLAAG